jgi:hypothetical protein
LEAALLAIIVIVLLVWLLSFAGVMWLLRVANSETADRSH